jgi:hypothetical protein
VSFSGVVKDPKGNPVTGAVDLTFSLFTFQEGGSPLWMETQNVQLDDQGRYNVLLGATNPEGLPLDLFTSGQAQWLGVQPELPGAAEQPRVLLVGMPYALKAVDADTLGGLPPAAFAMAATGAGSTSAAPSAAQTAGSNVAGPQVQLSSTITGSGTANTLAMFTGSSTIGNSLITQSGGAAVIGEALQVPALGTATSSTGFNAQPFDSLASAYNRSTKAAVQQHFRWQAEPVSNNTSSPSGKFNLLFASGAGSPAETGLSISSKGIFSFASGQTFPGTGSGTVTSVASGAGLTGGPITKTGTLSIATAGVTNTMLQHSSLTVTAGSGLTGGGAISLGGSATLSLATASCPSGQAAVALPLSCSPFATLGANSFNGDQTITGNVTASGVVSSAGLSSVAIGGTGVYGESDQDAALQAAVDAWEFGPTQKTFGLYGYTASPSGTAVYGQSVSSSFGGLTFAGAGVWGDTAQTANVGVLATAADGRAIWGVNNSPTGYPTLTLESEETSSSSNLLLYTYGDGFGGHCSIDVSGNLARSGSFTIPANANGRKTALYSVGAAENWFEDFGSGVLASGTTTVALDPTFAATVNTGIDYHVFLTPKGDCKGLYVTNETPAGFEVHEFGGGQSSVAFDYRIVAHRKGYENLRLADMTHQIQKLVQLNASRKGHSAGRVPTPKPARALAKLAGGSARPPMAGGL